MRGDKMAYMRALPDKAGSPPHARGQANCNRRNERGTGITPACAGTSGSRCRGFSRPWDHPRMRGDKCFGRDGCEALRGSPPHARGQAFLPVLFDPAPGITPACAGTSCMNCQQRHAAWDHPRMRGDKKQCAAFKVGHWGSPPHARGQVRRNIRPECKRGITPACAGTRQQALPPPRRRWDHPRMRGDKSPVPCALGCPSGSPPHARGQVGCCIEPRNDAGITPACAGTRRPLQTTKATSRGSPPHARGQVPGTGQGGAGMRITPACAGTSLWRSAAGG